MKAQLNGDEKTPTFPLRAQYEIAARCAAATPALHYRLAGSRTVKVLPLPGVLETAI